MKKKKTFTLVELLSVIVILAIPQIMSTIKHSAILIANQVEKDYISHQVLNKDYSVTSIASTDVAKLNDIMQVVLLIV